MIFLKKITSPQAITTKFPENQKNSNIFLIALSVTPYGVPALPKGEPSRLCCKLNNNLSLQIPPGCKKGVPQHTLLYYFFLLLLFLASFW